MADSSQIPTDGGFRADLKQSLLARRGLFFALAIVFTGALCAHFAWQNAKQRMRSMPEYVVTAGSIELTPQPAWLGADVKNEALRAAGLDGPTGETLSILDPPDRLEERIATALQFHPWVKQVGAIRKLPPNKIMVEVEYRSPLVAVQTDKALIPLDTDSHILSSQDLSPIELGYLPRINLKGKQFSGAAAPRAGQVWNSPRVVGAVALIAHLDKSWGPLNLLDVTPSNSLEVRGDLRYPVFELRTKGGTYISWGAAPGMGPPGESTFEEKLQRLNQYIAQNGPLGSVNNSPKWIDVRAGLRVEQRLAEETTTKTAGKEEIIK